MPSTNLQDLMARREARTSELSAKAREAQAAAEERKRAKFHDKRLGTAVGATVKGAVGFGILIDEISQILGIIDEAEKQKRAFRGDAEAIAGLDADLTDYKAAIAERAAGVEDVNLLICLAEMNRAEPSPQVIKRFIREGVDKFHVLAELDEVRGRARMDILKARKAGEITEIPVEHRGAFWRFEHDNTTSYITTVRFSPNEKTEIAQATAFAEYFGDLFTRFLEFRKQMGQNLAHLDHEATLTIESVNGGEVGLLKMSGLFHVDVEREEQKKAANPDYVPRTSAEDGCWKWTQPGRDGGGERELHAWGVLYLRVTGPRRAVLEVSHLARDHRLRKTMQHPSVGLLENDGTPKEITFGPNFSNVRQARGFSPLSNPAKTRAFLCQAAGLKMERNEDVPAPSLDEDVAPTPMAVAMQEATDRKKRGGKKSSRGRTRSDEE